MGVGLGLGNCFFYDIKGRKLVSHDRFFLRQITNRVFEIDQGEVNIFEGDYQYYLEKIKQIIKS